MDLAGLLKLKIMAPKLVSVVLAAFVLSNTHGTRLLDRNLVYQSPFGELKVANVACVPSSSLIISKLAVDTQAIQERQIQHVRRQYVDAESFQDHHYPTFYGGDFSNASSSFVL